MRYRFSERKKHGGAHSGTVGPYGFFCGPDGSRRLTAKGRALLAQWYADYPKPYLFLRVLFPAQLRILMRRGYTDEELSGVCVLAAVKAMVRYKPETGFSFKNYLGWWARSAVKDCLRASQLRLPVSSAMSLNRVIGPDGFTLHDKLPSREIAMRSDNVSEANMLLTKLPTDLWRTCVSMYFGLGGQPPMDSTEIGKQLGLSYSRAALIVRSAVARMKQFATPATM